jgi:hypothetical protein
MAATDWDALESEMGGNFKDFADDGVYKAKCNSVEIKEVGSNGSVIMKFGFEETDDVQYPTADHWLSFKNENFRKYHSRNLMMVLGAPKDAAQKAVDMCEGKSGKDAIVKAYEQTFGKLVAKKPEVEIEVYTDGKYARAEFTDRKVAMPHDGDKKEDKDEITLDAEDIDISDIPF